MTPLERAEKILDALEGYAEHEDNSLGLIATEIEEAVREAVEEAMDMDSGALRHKTAIEAYEDAAKIADSITPEKVLTCRCSCRMLIVEAIRAKAKELK